MVKVFTRLSELVKVLDRNLLLMQIAFVTSLKKGSLLLVLKMGFFGKKSKNLFRVNNFLLLVGSVWRS
jgi:hypothetical protein